MLLFVALVGAACSNGDGSYDYATSKGAALYQEMCQVCHGETGEGGLGPVLRDSKKSTGELESVIAARMPANAPGQCTGECASELAQFIREGLTTSALACNAVPPSARRLRLLTRREYRATVRDVFGSGAPAMSCARATDCAYRDTCTAGQCEPTACDAQTFVFDPQGHTYTRVHVAGDWNQWAATIAGGGLPLGYDAATGLWVGTLTVGSGRHLYKLVLDEQMWITDPRAPGTEPDGLGGQNSVVELACSGSADPVASFPVESRRAGFPFDTDSAAALVSSAHVDAYLAAAEKLAELAPPADVKTLGRRLFRRPLTTEEIARYTALATSDPKAALHAMLISPAFLYRSELGERSGDHYRLTPYEIATALSYMFVGTTPSDALLDAADKGELDKPAGIEKWARALLDDPRARTQVGELVMQWTGAQNVLGADKRADLFADFNDATRAALAAETRNFAQHVVFDGAGTFTELMTANYTIVDSIAAKFYGFTGSGRVNYDGTRAGLLGHASVLATTAHSDQTSPVLRGLLVRRNFLCQDLPPPPPFAGGLPAVDPNATTRDRFEMHSKTPSCRGCHQYIDSIGAGLERFDPVGRWREQENGQSIKAGGDLNDVERLGTDTSAPYQTLPELATALASSHAAQSCFVRQYLRFSRGVRETLAERCARIKLEDKLTAAGGNIRELMVQSVLSPDFVERR
ncbi:MAG TPA: DUF1592 domain-containing protein [Kofleriaceae bacterium]